ncbi:hypothetical protein BD408DRAFT_424378 [Parasitella parasitica]|nr:hypothetical protein BD408DRAFT_424378 [Parasitella parasitica]
MPTKPVENRKLKTGGAKGKIPGERKTEPPQPRNPSVGINDAHMAKMKRSKRTSFRRLLSLSIVTYLGYNIIYACGSPFDENSDKPAICEAIDPIKLDLYKMYETEFYQSNIDPHVGPFVSRASGLYNDYGVPALKKLSFLHDRYGKPLVDEGCAQASQVYVQHVYPKLSPIVEKSKIQVNQVKMQIQPYFDEASKQAEIAQNFAKQQWESLPTPVKEARDRVVETVLGVYHRAENTDLVPILIDIYWETIDFYQYQFRPFVQTHPATAHVSKFYDENVKSYVDKNVKPLLLLVKDRTHAHQLFNHALTLLPQRPIKNEPRKSTVASSIVETKTPVAATKSTFEIPITTPTAATTKDAKTKPKSSTEKAAESSSSAAPVKEKPVSTLANEKATTSSITTTVTATDFIQTKATNAKDASNDDDIIKLVSVRPTATPEYVDMKVESPQPDKKEAVYCPTCNAAEEQVIIAPTDKNVIPVHVEDKEVFEIRTEKQVFEVNKEPFAVPPQSPVRKEQEETADTPDNQKVPVIVASKPKSKDQAATAKEDPKEKQEQVATTQVEDQALFDTHDKATESKDNKDDLPELAVPSHGEEEAPTIKVVVGKQQTEVPVPVAKEEGNIVVPNDENGFADTNEQIVIQAPAKEEIFDEPIVKKPIVPNDESQFEARPQEQQQQQAEPPVRYHRLEKALSQCPPY